MTTHLTRGRLWLVPCFATLAIMLSAQYASASLSFAITGTNGATSFTVPQTGGTFSYPLILYAMIQDSSASGSSNIGGADPNGNDGVYAIETGIDLTGGLVSSTNNAYFAHTGNTATVTYTSVAPTKGTAVQPWGSGSSGTIGIGATNSTATSPTSLLNNTLYASNSNVLSPANVSAGNIAALPSLGATAATWSTDSATYATLAGAGGTLENYTAIPIAKFTVSFSGTLPAGKTATLGLIEGSINGSPTSGVDNWAEAGTDFLQNGNGSITGPVGSGLPGVLGGLLDTITFSTTVNSSVVAGNVTLSGLPASASVLSGATLPLSLTVANTGSATGQEAVTAWNVLGSTGFTGTSSTVNLAVGGGSATFAASYTAPANVFGPTTLTVSTSGYGVTLASNTTSQSSTINVIGFSTTGAGGTFGVASSATVGLGASLANLTSTLGNSSTSYGIGNTTLTILAGNALQATTITTQWRSRNASETPGTNTGLPLYSDVAQLKNVYGVGVSGSSATNPYALEMSYDPAVFASSIGTETVGSAISNGLLYLGNLSSVSGKWISAVDPSLIGTAGSASNNASSTPILQPFSTWYAGEIGAGQNLQTLLGSWGVDTANNEAWAIVNYDAQFAVVPEPGTLALLAAGAVALGVAYRRRKVAKS